MKLSCPACGAEVQLSSKSSVFVVCRYCRATLVRRDLALESVGKMAELQDDASPVQLGTRGNHAGAAFEVVGRLRISWSEGSWNEWFVSFHDGRSGWLAEAQGFYAVSFAVPAAQFKGSAADLKPGVRVQLQGKEFTVDDIKQVRCSGSEGELPFSGQAGRESVSVDLTGAGGAFACLDFSDEGTAAYAGTYVEAETLKLTNLRAFDGW